jgi:hypothetical protein
MVTEGQQNLETVIFDYLGASVKATKKPSAQYSIPTLPGRVSTRTGSVTVRTRSSRHRRRGSGFVAMWRHWSSSGLAVDW